MVYSNSEYAADVLIRLKGTPFFYFSRPGYFFVVGFLFISVSSLLGRKKGRNGIGMVISGAEN